MITGHVYSTFGSHPCTVTDVHAAAIYVIHQYDMLSSVYCSLIFFLLGTVGLAV